MKPKPGYLPGFPFFRAMRDFDFFFVRCCGGLFATTSTARSKRDHASGAISILASVGFFAMTKPKPRDVYQRLCERLRQRIEFAEAVFKSDAPDWQKIEIMALQGRKSVETIAHLCLVATEHGLGELGIPRDAKQHWNAETIFGRLKKKGLKILPSPSRTKKSPHYSVVVEGIPENRLSHDDLIALYQQFHKALHDENPYRLKEVPSTLPDLVDAFRRIKKFVWLHMIGIKGQAFLVCLSDNHGKVAVLPMAKAAELPIGD